MRESQGEDDRHGHRKSIFAGLVRERPLIGSLQMRKSEKKENPRKE
jgi:hypothetical protein